MVKSDQVELMAGSHVEATYSVVIRVTSEGERTPGKIMATGVNYADHVAEAGLEPPKQQSGSVKSEHGSSALLPQFRSRKPIPNDRLGQISRPSLLIVARPTQSFSRARVPATSSPHDCIYSESRFADRGWIRSGLKCAA
jgi:hypothetical protein